MKNTFLILILIFVFGTFSKSAANDIFIADTTLSRQFPAVIHLQGNLDNAADSVKIVIKYDANQLNIIDVFSDENNIFMEPQLSFYSWGENLSTQVLVITSKKINPKGKYFCEIKLQALISEDSVYQFTPSELLINGVKTDSVFKTAQFFVKNPVKVTNKSEIGYFFPNPFSYESKVEFTLLEDAKVGINIYNSFGKLARSVEKNYESPELLFLNSENQIFAYDPEQKLPKGRYYMNWQPKLQIWPSGAYYIVFDIGGETYQTNVLFVR